MNKQDYELGKKGEEFFLNISAYTFFNNDAIWRDTQTGKHVSIADLRANKKEGEYALADGSLVEVKTDTRCYETGNIIVELSGRNNDVGWFQHCKENGVKYLIWHLYRGSAKKYPYLCIRFDFPAFDSYIRRLIGSHEYMKKNCRTKPDYDGSVFTILKVNLEDAIQSCDPLIAITQENQPELLSALQKSLKSALSNIGIQAEGMPDPKECVIQYSPKRN